MSSTSRPAAATGTLVAQRAFPAQPRVDRYFAASSVEAARRRLVQCVLRGDGPALLLGAPGVGKSMLLQVLAAELEGKLCVVRLASSQLCTRRALLQAILHGLDAPYRDREEGELRFSLADLLNDPKATGEGVALLVDEAQSLPTRLLEELRVLTNLSVDGSPRLRIVLAGSNALDEAFTAPALESFSQRLAARCYLEPLNREETGQYVRAHLAAAGADPDKLMTTDAHEALMLASEGLPRLINQVADRALVLAVERGETVLNGEAINEAWSDLHQLPTPWQSPASSKLAASTTPPSEPEPESSIEFGVLDDDSDDLDVATFGEALQAEAEPITASQKPERVEAVWDAGDKLRELSECEALLSATDGDTVIDEDDEDVCVSYAFPGTLDAPSEEPETPAADEPEVDESAAAEAGSADPFAESFDEEEVVIDPYAELERVIPAAPVVTSFEPSQLAAALSTIDELPEFAPRGETIATSVATEPAATAVATLDDAEILVVDTEDEVQVDAPTAHRQEYTQLFANLRQG
ncbi:MAG: AAA family ATPase [Planctomycetota bacterium]